MNFFSFIVIFLYAFNSFAASHITFDRVSGDEVSKVQNHLISFYSQELLKAGLFTNEALAFQAAKEEVLQEATNIPLSFLYLTPDECNSARFGYIAYSIDGKTAYIESIYLDEKYRGQGLGKAALYALEKELQKNSISVIKLYVFVHNQAAFHLYKKIGYEIENSYFNDEVPIGYHMKKEILSE
ncbi:MAG: GNAT family N-acetyltransferase [Chlamydiota bacterium]|jgi:ribosomal protein S18 acetylase RimI-like enzyme